MQLVATHHIAIYTPHFEEMERFYTETLGLPVTLRWDDVNIIFIDVGSTQIELIGRPVNAEDGGPHQLDQGIGLNHIALQVASVDEAVQELVDRGVSILRQPRDFQTIRIAFFSDPDGNMVELVENRA